MKRLNIVLALLLPSIVFADWFDMHEKIMNSTFKIEAAGSFGTGFLLGRLTKTDTKAAYPVLVTAAHVLETAQGENAKIHLRVREKDGSFRRLVHTFPIRIKDRPLWFKHPQADVAAMYFAIPPQAYVELLPTTLLVTDEILKDYHVGPGYTLFALGYPFGAEANDAGFPILRSGAIASYPILPTDRIKTFLFDLEVRKGNSGGPVYLAYTTRLIPTEGLKIRWVNSIIGLISQEKAITQEIRSPYRVSREEFPINVAVVVQASVIRETVNLLPWP